MGICSITTRQLTQGKMLCPLYSGGSCVLYVTWLARCSSLEHAYTCVNTHVYACSRELHLASLFGWHVHAVGRCNEVCRLLGTHSVCACVCVCARVCAACVCVCVCACVCACAYVRVYACADVLALFSVYTGFNNNEENPMWGSVSRTLRREFPSAYSDGIDMPAGQCPHQQATQQETQQDTQQETQQGTQRPTCPYHDEKLAISSSRPSPRLISNVLFAQVSGTAKRHQMLKALCAPLVGPDRLGPDVPAFISVHSHHDVCGMHTHTYTYTYTCTCTCTCTWSMMECVCVHKDNYTIVCMYSSNNRGAPVRHPYILERRPSN